MGIGKGKSWRWGTWPPPAPVPGPRFSQTSLPTSSLCEPLPRRPGHRGHGFRVGLVSCAYMVAARGALDGPRSSPEPRTEMECTGQPEGGAPVFTWSEPPQPGHWSKQGWDREAASPRIRHGRNQSNQGLLGVKTHVCVVYRVCLCLCAYVLCVLCIVFVRVCVRRSWPRVRRLWDLLSLGVDRK